MRSVPEFPASIPAGETPHRELDRLIPPGEMSSDYQWLSLRTWNPEARLSVLDGALVVAFRGYHDPDERFYGFVGGHDADRVAGALLEESVRRGWGPRLRLVPDSVVARLGDALVVDEDRDNFDYVYRPVDAVQLEGSQHRMSRKHRNHFAADHDGRWCTRSTTATDADWSRMIGLTEQWAEGTPDLNAALDEIKALMRCSDSVRLAHDHLDLVITSLEVDGCIVGFDITEVVDDTWALNHFRHTPHELVGSHVTLRRAVAVHLQSIGVTLWNAEQDLGVVGLRARKLRDRPDGFVKKYDVALPAG